jgi:hypothetical protein
MTEASSIDQGEAELARLYSLIVDIFRGGLAGTLAGVLFLGLGARIVMRISALLNPEAEGAITDNENIVGEITLAGTLELIIFAGLAGGLAVGTVWVLVRDWLPRNPVSRPLLAALLTACAGSFAVIAAHNEDFQILDPPELHIVMFVLLLALTGFATATFDGMLEGRMPSNPTVAAILGGLIGIGLVFVLPLLVLLFFINEDNQRPPWPAGIALIAASVATMTTWVRYYSSGDAALAQTPPWQKRLGVGSVVLLGLLGAIHLAAEIEAIV